MVLTSSILFSRGGKKRQGDRERGEAREQEKRKRNTARKKKIIHKIMAGRRKYRLYLSRIRGLTCSRVGRR